MRWLVTLDRPKWRSKYRNEGEERSRGKPFAYLPPYSPSQPQKNDVEVPYGRGGGWSCPLEQTTCKVRCTSDIGWNQRPCHVTRLLSSAPRLFGVSHMHTRLLVYGTLITELCRAGRDHCYCACFRLPSHAASYFLVSRAPSETSPMALRSRSQQTWAPTGQHGKVLLAGLMALLFHHLHLPVFQAFQADAYRRDETQIDVRRHKRLVLNIISRQLQSLRQQNTNLATHQTLSYQRV